VGATYSMWAGLNWKTCARSLVRVTGRHSLVRQSSFHVHVICRRRPLPVRVTVGGPAGWYGWKWVMTRTFEGATHLRSATIATRAVIGSPKRCTPGSIEA